MSDRYYLPTTTASILNDYVGQCKNLGLLLDKYPPIEVIGNSQGKSSWLRKLEPNRRVDSNLAKAAYDRWYHMVAAIEGMKIFYAAADWRMIVGLGGETVLETDITLHHLYGTPFIPGSALKGLTRAYAAGEIYPSTDIDKDHEVVKQIFGTQEKAGTVIFFDAMPIDGQATFALDIMNPHYPDYYGGSKPPTNDQDPRPITFLTVTDTTFVFALAPRNPKEDRHVKDTAQAAEWLQTALEKYGIGGKTSAGYGVMKLVSTPAEEERIDLDNPEIQVAKNLADEIATLPDQNLWRQIEQKYVRRLRDLKFPGAQALLAKAIVDRVRQAGIEQRVSSLPLYRVILGYLAKK